MTVDTCRGAAGVWWLAVERDTDAAARVDLTAVRGAWITVITGQGRVFTCAVHTDRGCASVWVEALKHRERARGALDIADIHGTWVVIITDDRRTGLALPRVAGRLTQARVLTRRATPAIIHYKCAGTGLTIADIDRTGVIIIAYGDSPCADPREALIIRCAGIGIRASRPIGQWRRADTRHRAVGFTC